MNWPLLEELKKNGILTFLDLHFARRAAKYLGSLTEEEASVFAIAMAAARQGHLCVDSSTLGDELFRQGILSVKTNPFLHIEEGRVYLPKNKQIENSIMAHLRRLAGKKSEAKLPPFPLADKLNLQQKEAVGIAINHRLTLLTGGPGTGKTFTAAAIVQAFSPLRKVILAAPTGRAADNLKKRIQGIEPFYAGTLHTLLGTRNIEQPPEFPWLDADLILVDECSMIDAPLLRALLSALPDSATTVLMGDPDQLSPVGIGSLFSDLSSWKTDIPLGRAHLQQCVRTDEMPLLELTTALQKNLPCEWPLLSWAMEDHEEFYKKIWETTKSFWPKPTSHVPDRHSLLEEIGRFRILSTLRHGLLGTEAINEYLARRLRSLAKPGDWKLSPIQITRNDSATGLCNGELGILIERQRSESYALFPGIEAPIPISMLPSYELAFCTSVHKSQGSEYQEVLLIVPPGSESFGREMLYTGITRAKKKLSIVSTQEILSAMQKQRLHRLSGFRF